LYLFRPERGSWEAAGVGSAVRRWPTAGSKERRRQPAGSSEGAWVEVARETLGGVGGRPDGVLWRVEKIRKINTEKIRKKVEKKIKEKKKKGHYGHCTLLSTLHNQEKSFCQIFS
jgi:hypothetical protein